MEWRGAIEQEGIESCVWRFCLFVYLFIYLFLISEIPSPYSNRSEVTVDLYLTG